MPEMTPLEAAEKLGSLADDADSIEPEKYGGAKLVDVTFHVPGDIKALRYSASTMRQIAAGELRPVIHAHPVMKHRHIGGYKYANCTECGTEIEIEHPAECDIPYCSNCGAELAESFQNVCPRCGALMDGKDDSHE